MQSLATLIAGTLFFGVCLQWTCVSSLNGTVNNSMTNGTESEDCVCNSIGSLKPFCDNTTSACDCRTGYQGPNCTDCQNGYHRHSHRTTECISCHCNATGSLSNECDRYGSCSCKPGIGGRTCDMCLSGFYDLQTNGCQPCRCHETVTKCLHTSKSIKSVDASMCHRCLLNVSWINKCRSAVCHSDEFLATNGSCTPCRCSHDPHTVANGSRLCDLTTGKCLQCEGELCPQGNESAPSHLKYEAYIIAIGSIAGVVLIMISILLAIYCRRCCRRKSRRTPLPLWTIELRREEDEEEHGNTTQELVFSDIDVMYLDDSYLMESSDYFTESSDSINRNGYHTLS